VVVLDQIVVDSFRNVDAAQVVAGLARFIVDDANGVRGIVAAGVKEIADLVRPQDLEDLLAILQIRLVARRAKRRRRRIGDHLQIMGGLLGQIVKILIQDPAHTVHGAVDQLDTAEFA
jgi:hypothetical protein